MASASTRWPSTTNDELLPNTGEALRTKQLMAAGVQTFCPDHDDQIALLDLP